MQMWNGNDAVITRVSKVQLEAAIKNKIIYEKKPYQLIAKCLSNHVLHDHNSSIEWVVNMLRVFKLHGEEADAFNLLEQAWKKYKDTLYRQAKRDHFEKQLHITGNEETYRESVFRSITFASAFQEPLWRTYCQGMSRNDDYAIIKQLDELWRLKRVTTETKEQRQLVRKKTLSVDHERSVSEGCTDSISWWRRELTKLKQWYAERLENQATLEKLKQVHNELQQVLDEIKKIAAVAYEDPIEASIASFWKSEHYNYVCSLSIEKIFQVWVEQLKLGLEAYKEYCIQVQDMVTDSLKSTTTTEADFQSFLELYEISLQQFGQKSWSSTETHVYNMAQDHLNKAWMLLLETKQPYAAHAMRIQQTLQQLSSHKQAAEQNNKLLQESLGNTIDMNQLKTRLEKVDKNNGAYDCCQYLRHVVNIGQSYLDKITNEANNKQAIHDELLSMFQTEYNRIQKTHNDPSASVLPDSFTQQEQRKTTECKRIQDKAKEKLQLAVDNLFGLMSRTYSVEITEFMEHIQKEIQVLRSKILTPLPFQPEWPSHVDDTGKLQMPTEQLEIVQRTMYHVHVSLTSTYYQPLADRMQQESENDSSMLQRLARYRVNLAETKTFIAQAPRATFKEAFHAVYLLAGTWVELSLAAACISC